MIFIDFLQDITIQYFNFFIIKLKYINHNLKLIISNKIFTF